MVGWILGIAILVATLALLVYVLLRIVRSGDPASGWRGAVRDFFSGFPKRYRAALVVCALAIPYLSALFACVDYLAPLQVPQWIVARMPSNSFLAGTLVALIVWLVLALFCPTDFSSGNGVSPDSYADIQSRHQVLAGNLSALANSQPAPAVGSLGALAIAQAAAGRDTLTQALAARGNQWLWGYGYISAWRTLHRAEEALISVLPCELICQGGIADHLRLHGSTIENREELNRNLAFAVVRLDGSIASVVDVLGTPAAPPPPPPPPPSPPPSEPQLRMILMTVRQAINTFRDDQWVGLVNTRNLLYKIMMLLGLGALLLLGLCLSVGATHPAIIAAMAYFVVGVILGRLFSQLSVALQNNDAVGEDYGLSTARMLATPLFTGLAAVGGVFLAVVIPSILDFTPMLASATATPRPVATVVATTQPTPVPSVNSRRDGAIPLTLREVATPTATVAAPTAVACPPAASTATARSVPTLGEIFDYNPIKFIVAAFFGLTPAYFFDRLGQANKQIMNIISTEPTNKARG